MYKLARVTYSLDPVLGGPYSVVKNSSTYLREEFDLTTLVFGNSDLIMQNQITHPTYRNNHVGFFFRPLPKKMKNTLKTSDILLIHGFYLFSTLVSIRIFQGKSIFLMPHGTFEIYQQKQSRIRKKLFDLILKVLLKKRNIHFIVASESEIKGVLHRFPKATVTKIGLGVDIPVLPKSKRTLDPKSPRLLSYSRIAKKKRIDLTIRAMLKLKQLGFNPVLDIVGKGDDQIELELLNLSKSLQLTNSINFIGFVHPNQRAQVFANADLLILPSENENFANSVAEAISYHVPVVISKEVALSEFVFEKKCGIVLSSCDPITISDAIAIIVKDYDTFSVNCKNASHNLSWSSVGLDWIQIIKRGTEMMIS